MESSLASGLCLFSRVPTTSLLVWGKFSTSISTVALTVQAPRLVGALDWVVFYQWRKKPRIRFGIEPHVLTLSPIASKSCCAKSAARDRLGSQLAPTDCCRSR